MAILRLLAAAVAAAEPREAFIEAYVARHREEVCGTHWAGNPTYAACLAMLRREAEREFARRAEPLGSAPPGR